MIIHPVILADPREAATYHLRTAIVDGCATRYATHYLLEEVWLQADIADALWRIWSYRRRFSRDHATIPQEAPHACA